MSRLRYIQNWIDNALPSPIQISKLFLPRNCLIGSHCCTTFDHYSHQATIRKNPPSPSWWHLFWNSCVVRKRNYSICSAKQPGFFCHQRPVFGGCQMGLWEQYPRWAESIRAVLCTPSCTCFVFAPSNYVQICLIPKRGKPTMQNCYSCPVFITLERKGSISTLGDSENYVTTFSLPSNTDPDKWTRRGTALFLQLNFWTYLYHSQLIQ